MLRKLASGVKDGSVGGAEAVAALLVALVARVCAYEVVRLDALALACSVLE